MSTPVPATDAEAPFTTADVNQMLWNRYTDNGKHVILFDVPDIVGINQRRRCDAIAIGMWQSSGHLIHGFEVKVSRGDWLREVKNVTKADPFLERCDRWWLVTGDVAIAKPEEIPDAWGWMTATKTGLRVQRPAKPLPQDPNTMHRLWAFALIRRAVERDGKSAEFQAMLEKERIRIQAQADDHIRREIAHAVPAYEKLRERVEKFEKDSGMKLEDWRLGNVGKLARRIVSLTEEGYGGLTKTLQRQLQALQTLSDNVTAALEAVASPALDETDPD